MATFWSEYWLVITFYVLLIASIYIFRKKFEFQGKIIAILRTNTGIEWMQRMGEKYPRTIRVIGYIGIVVGFIGMAVIIGYLIYGIYSLIFLPQAPPVLSPVLPGVKVPGSTVYVPLFEGLIALFIVIVVHEAAHGLVAAAHGLKVKSSGLVLFGPLPGAFVEPDEKKLRKSPHRVQHSVFAAGPWSNVIQAGVFLVLFLGVSMLTTPLLDPAGLRFSELQEGSPAEAIGLPVDEVYMFSSAGDLHNVNDLIGSLQNVSVGDEYMLGTADQNYTLTLGAHPTDPDKPWIGIAGIETVFGFEEAYPFFFWIITFIQRIIFWVFVLALGLGLANLIPLGPVDGGRMWQLVLHKWLGEERGDMIWSKSAMALFAIVIVLVLVPIVKSLLGF